MLESIGPGIALVELSGNGGRQIRSFSDHAGLDPWISLSPHFGWSVCCAPVDSGLCFFAQVTPDQTVRVSKGGQSSYEVIDTVATGTPKAMEFLDASRGCLLTVREVGGTEVWLTVDGGYNWYLSLSSDKEFRHAEWCDTQTLWVVGDSGIVLKTSDGGSDWIEVAVPVSNDLMCVSSYSPDSLWIGGAEGLVMATGDAGATWTLTPVADPGIVMIQTFEDAVYAYGTYVLTPQFQQVRAVYRYVHQRDDLPGQGSLSGWTHTDQGVIFRPGPDEVLISVQLFDLTGRRTAAPLRDLVLDLRAYPAGLYLLRYTSNKRQECGQLLWLSADR